MRVGFYYLCALGVNGVPVASFYSVKDRSRPPRSGGDPHSGADQRELRIA